MEENDPYEGYFPIHNNLNIERLSYYINLQYNKYRIFLQISELMEYYLELLTIIPDSILYRVQWDCWKTRLEVPRNLKCISFSSIVISIDRTLSGNHELNLTLIDSVFRNELSTFMLFNTLRSPICTKEFISKLEDLIIVMDNRNNNYSLINN